MTKFQRFALLCAILNVILLASACDSTWIGQANNIIAVLLPAITSAVLLIGGFMGLPSNLVAAIQQWGATASDALTNIVQPALDAYNNATSADAKAVLLSKIKAALDSIVSNLQTVFADVHLNDPSKQAKISGIIGLIESMLISLINFIPVITAQVKGEPIDPQEAHARMHAVKPAKVFKKEFNNLVVEFGDQYKI